MVESQESRRDAGDDARRARRLLSIALPPRGCTGVVPAGAPAGVPARQSPSHQHVPRPGDALQCAAHPPVSSPLPRFSDASARPRSAVRSDRRVSAYGPVDGLEVGCRIAAAFFFEVRSCFFVLSPSSFSSSAHRLLPHEESL